MYFHPKGQYLEIHQTRDSEPGDYENILADALERAFSAGVTDLDGVVKGLIEYGVPAPAGQSWSASLLSEELKRLGQ